LPEISVIVTTFNRAHMVSQTINSILAQTCEDFELIIVDNESVDNTEKVITSYSDKRLRYFKNPNNGIVAVNRNFGIQQSQGTYIAFCDDDDLWLPDKLERQLTEFNRDSYVGMVCSNAINFDDKRQYGNRIKPKLDDRDFTFEALIHSSRIILSTVITQREVLNDVGSFDISPEIFSGEDYELWLRIAYEYKIKYVNSPLIKYRTHLGGFSQDRDYIKRLGITEAVYRKLIEKDILSSDLYQKAIKRRKLNVRIKTILRYNWVTTLVERIFRSPIKWSRSITK